MRSNFRNMQTTQLYFFLMSSHCQGSLIHYRFLKRCSGLKLNQTTSEMLWLGSMRNRKDTMHDLQLSAEPVYAIGAHFTYDLEVSEKKNVFDKLGCLKKTLKETSPSQAG